MNKKQLKIVTSVAIVVLIVSILPVFWIGQYLHPFSDDYVFGAEAHKIWNATHSFGACLHGAWNVAVNMYHIWQGTYSACFLMALQPGAFGAYWIVPIILASCLILSTYTLLYMIMRKLLHTSKLEYLLVSTVFVLINVQFVRSSYDAFYWYNGAMYYTLYYSLSLCLAALLIQFELSHSVQQRIGVGAISVVLTLFIAGGNFVSGFATATILFTAIAIILIEQKRMPAFLISILLIYLAAFSFSILAPGNTFRELAVKESHPSLITALGITLGRSLSFIGERIVSFMSLTFMTLVPIVSKLARRSHFKFSHPWLCIILTFILYCAFFFPHCYAMGYEGPYRVQNVYTYALFWLVLINMFYLSGAMARKAEVNAPLSSAFCHLYEAFKYKYKKTLKYSYIYASIIYIMAVVIKPSTTNRTLSLLTNGQIQASDKEMREREEMLELYNNSIVEMKPLTTKLPSDTHYDAMPNPGYWVNQAIALYYGKQEVYTTPSFNINNENTYLMKHYKTDVGPNNLKYRTFKKEPSNQTYLTQRSKRYNY